MSIPEEYFTKPVRSMPTRVTLVKLNRGKSTKYGRVYQLVEFQLKFNMCIGNEFDQVLVEFQNIILFCHSICTHSLYVDLFFYLKSIQSGFHG